MDSDTRELELVLATEESNQKLPARLSKHCTTQKVPLRAVQLLSEDNDSFSVFEEAEEDEQRLKEDVVTSGGFATKIDTTQFLPLLGKLLKFIVESLDSVQY